MTRPQSISFSPESSGSRTAGKRRGGFTLIELMTVVGIMALISAAALPAIGTLGGSSRLNSAGSLVSNLVSVARSESINQSTLVQLRVVTNYVSGAQDSTVPYRKISLWKLVQTSTSQSFVQFSNWETLPPGVIIDPSSDPTSATPAYTFASQPGTYFLNPALSSNPPPTLTYNNGTYHYASVEFSPTGATTYPAGYPTVYLLLTEATIPSTTGAPVYMPANHPNWFQVSIHSLTGMSEVVRP